MEDGDRISSLCSNIPAQDILENFDFEAFLNWDLPEAAEPSVGTQQSQVPALPTGKKRRSNATTQPRIKRPRIQHSHICDIHEPPSSNPAVRCFGKRSRMGPHKGTRCERMVATIVEGELPVCAQHRAQVIKMTRCEALLECGFSCNEIVPWKPYGYPLCEAHWSKGKCYFLELPVEIRLLIYQHLIPDQPVQARRSGPQSLRKDRTPVYTAIFRVNRTVHEEVADLFYGHTTFNIDVTNEQEGNRVATPSISVCYAKDERCFLTEFQMQLLLLQQGRGRTAVNRTTPSHPIRHKRLATGIKHLFTPWQPALSLRYFRRIRYFRINIAFIAPKKTLSTSTSSQAAETILAEAERNVLCDYLHRMVEGLVTKNQAPLRNLDISIRVHGISVSDDDDASANSKALMHCQALVKPIRRLRSRTANLVSLTRTGDGLKEINLLPVHSKEDDQISRFVRNCCAELTHSLKPPPKSPVLLRFGQLAELVSQMCEHPFWRETDIEEIEILLSNGRSAREANDIKALISVFRDVFDKLKKYNADHQDFMKQMKQSYEIMRSNGT